MRQFRLRQQLLRERQDNRHASFVIGTEQSLAAGRDQVVSDGGFEFGIVPGLEHARRIVGQANGFAIPPAMHDGLHAGRAEIRRGIHMRQEGDGGQGFATFAGGHGRHKVPLRTEMDRLQTQ